MVIQQTLTKREVEILRLIAMGQSSEQIAIICKISRRTVETHRRNISRKINSSSLVEFVKMAIRMQLVPQYVYLGD